MLTYFSLLLAKIWERGEEVRRLTEGPDIPPEVAQAAARMQMDVGLGCCFAEQVATEGGARHQLGWLLTGLEEPPFSTTQQNKPRAGGAPHGKLVDPQWIAAQLAHLKDLDVMTERMKKQPHSGGGGGGKGDPKGEGK